MGGPRTFTLDEANAAVPRLGILVERLQRQALALERERLACAEGRGEADVPPEVLLRERPVARLAAESLDEIMGEFEALGVHLKDVALGLVDFPSERDGRHLLLCWQYGEPEIAYWHGLDEGFTGRKPIAGVRARPPLQ